MEHTNSTSHMPIRVGDLWRKTFAVYRKNFRAIASVALPLTALFLMVNVLTQINDFSTYSLSVFIPLQILIAIGTALFFVASLIYPAVLILGSLEHESTSHNQFIKDVYRKAALRFGSFLWIIILTGVIGTLAYAIFILPGIFVQVMLAFSIIVLFAEKKTGVKALAQSWKYVRGHWWASFGRLFLLVIAILVAAIVVHIIFVPLSLLISNNLQLAAILDQLFQIFVILPIVIIYLITLYHSLKSLHPESVSESEVDRSRQVFAWIVLLGLAFSVALLGAGAQIANQVLPPDLYFGPSSQMPYGSYGYGSSYSSMHGNFMHGQGNSAQGDFYPESGSNSY